MGIFSSLKEAFGFSKPTVPPNPNKAITKPILPNVPQEWEDLPEDKLSIAKFTLIPIGESFDLHKISIENEFWESRVGVLANQGLIDKRMNKYSYITKPVEVVLNTRAANNANPILVKIAGEEIGYVAPHDIEYAKFILAHGDIKYFSTSIRGGAYKKVVSTGETTKGYTRNVVDLRIGFVRRPELTVCAMPAESDLKKQVTAASQDGGITLTFMAEPPKESKAVRKEKKRLSQCVYDYVIIDFETTGFNAPAPNRERYDEVLSVSIIDQDGNTLIDTLCKPQHRKSWPKATEYNGITPAMVKDKPTFEDIFPTVKNILLKAKYVLAYNIKFEYDFLTSYDYLFCFSGNTKLRELLLFGPDPMLMFQAFDRPNESYSLIAAGEYFGFDFRPHESLEDVKATLYVYKQMLEHVKGTDDEAFLIEMGYNYKCGAAKAKWLDPLTGEITDEALIT